MHDLFSVSPETLTGILLMAAVTFGLKISGLATQRLIKPSPFAERFLNALPAGVILSFITPMVITAGPAGYAALAAAIIAALRLKNVLIATAIGVAVGLLVRHALNV